MVRPILLDTCALLWLANKEPIADAALEALAVAEEQPGGLLVSPISAWEIGQLVAKERIVLPFDPLAWFETTLGSGIVLAELTPAVLVASSFLPGAWLRDPADRIVAATGRAFGYRIMTRDRPLLEFAAAGHAQTIAC
jgi:PIN domain nuclease of toxin-antitoxin system